MNLEEAIQIAKDNRGYPLDAKAARVLLAEVERLNKVLKPIREQVSLVILFLEDMPGGVAEEADEDDQSPPDMAQHLAGLALRKLRAIEAALAAAEEKR